MATTQELRTKCDESMTIIYQVMDSSHALEESISKALCALDGFQGASGLCLAYFEQLQKAKTDVQELIRASEKANDEFSKIRAELFDPVPPPMGKILF